MVWFGFESWLCSLQTTGTQTIYYFFLCCSCFSYKRMILIAPTVQSYDDWIFSPFEVSRILIVVQSLSHVRLCDPMDCSMPGCAVLHFLPQFAQIHVYWELINMSIKYVPHTPTHSSDPSAASYVLDTKFKLQCTLALAPLWPPLSALSPSLTVTQTHSLLWDLRHAMLFCGLKGIFISLCLETSSAWLLPLLQAQSRWHIFSAASSRHAI